MNSKTAPCVFVNKEKDIYLLIYVDDILIAGKEEKNIVAAKKEIAAVYDVKDLGELSYFLGTGVRRYEDGSFAINQNSYIDSICDRFSMSDARPVASPVEIGQLSQLRSLEPNTAQENCDMKGTPYRELIGGLLFVLVQK